MNNATNKSELLHLYLVNATTCLLKTHRTTISIKQLDHVKQLEKRVQLEIKHQMSLGLTSEVVRGDVLTLNKTSDKKGAKTTNDQTNGKGFINSINVNNPTGGLRQSSTLN